jgi:peptidyl-prolyl cis-trans isomerase C
MKLRYPFNLVVPILAAVVLTPAVVIGLSYLAATAATRLPDGVAFRVYDTDVSETQLKHRLDLLRGLYGIQAPPDPAQADRFRRDSARAIVLGTVLDRAARDAGIVVDAQARSDALAQFIADRFPEGRPGFVKLLGQVGVSEQDVVDELVRQQATKQLYDKIVTARGAEFDPSLDEMHRYYDQNRASLVRPETRHLRNIVVAGQEQAQQVVDRVRAGADFGQLATELSLDLTTRDSGGDLGPVPRAQLEDEYGAAAFAAPVGAVFGPVHAKRGWNVGQVVEIQPAVPLAFEQVVGRLAFQLRARRSMEFWRGWVSDQIERAHVEYAAPYRPSEGTDGPVDADPGIPASPTTQEPR